MRIDNGTDLCFWLARDAREFSESRPVFPSANNLESFHYLIYTNDTQALALGRRPSQTLVTTEQFVEHAAVADGASNLFVQLFGAANGHMRTVYGVQSLPIGTPVIVEVTFEIK